MRLRSKKSKKSHKTIGALLLVPVAAVWDKISNFRASRKHHHGWRRIFGH